MERNLFGSPFELREKKTISHAFYNAHSQVQISGFEFCLNNIFVLFDLMNEIYTYIWFGCKMICENLYAEKHLYLFYHLVIMKLNKKPIMRMYDHVANESFLLTPFGLVCISFLPVNNHIILN